MKRLEVWFARASMRNVQMALASHSDGGAMVTRTAPTPATSPIAHSRNQDDRNVIWTTSDSATTGRACRKTPGATGLWTALTAVMRGSVVHRLSRVQKTTLSSLSDQTTTEVFRRDTEDMIHEPEYIKPTWIAILTTALILTCCLVALSSVLLKCKRDRRRGRRGVWVTPRIFGPDGHGQIDRIELNQPCTFVC